MRYKRLKYFFLIGGVILTFFIVLLVVAQYVLVLEPPTIENRDVVDLPIIVENDSLTYCGDSWLHVNSGGVDELFITGTPFEMGVKNGKLTQKAAALQERYFFDFIKALIPSETMLQYLKYFIAFFNKDLDEYIPLNLRKEIYGISLFSSDEFDFVGEKYHRVLNYHAAHDIGHTIQNMNLVNCTAFSVQQEYTVDSSLFIGRNLDFSAGDDFARDKLVVFCAPDTGYRFSYISWAGMIGVLSGMNERGVTITLNSAKSGIPITAKTPVSLISREVLQYAKNIEEAFAIIASYDSFVSETFFVGSAADNRAVVVEKSLDTTVLYSSLSSKLVATNHFQSSALVATVLNQEAINDGCSMYRWQRTNELIDSSEALDEVAIIEILRDKYGLENSAIGIGNESAVDQLICHHAVVFHPQTRKMWVSQFPYQENSFLAYDLTRIFDPNFDPKRDEIAISEEKIPPTQFYKEGKVDSLWCYRRLMDSIKYSIDNKLEVKLSNAMLQRIEKLNPHYYYTYYQLARYCFYQQEYKKAKDYIDSAAQCQLTHGVNREQVEALNNQIVVSLNAKLDE